MMTNKAILVTRPNYDIITTYFYHWSESILMLAAQKGYKVFDLAGSKASRSNFESYSKKHNPNFFFFNGHGSDEVVAGQNHELLLISGKNDSLSKDSIVYIRSCSAAKILGPSLINQATKAVIGYTTKFGFMRLVDKESKPLSDPLAELFLKPSNIVATTFLKGHTAFEAHQRSINGMKKNLRKMLSSENPFSDSTSIVLLWSNIKGQILLGDPQAKI